MPKLPTREDLGAPPNIQSRSVARVSVQGDGGASLARGAANLGRGIAAIGAALSEASDKRDEFETERAYQEFDWAQKQSLDRSKQSMQPGQAAGFADQWQKGYVENAKEFFKTVPDRLKPHYEQKLFRAERGYFGDATETARHEQKRFGIASLGSAKENVFQPRARVTPTEQLNTLTMEYERLVDASPDLTPIEKDEEKRKARREIGLSHLDSLPTQEGKKIIGGRLTPEDASAPGLLRRFEGFRDQAYWDVNAYRVGYGSDTVTRADGKIEKVTKDTRITREDAERDLARRSGEFASVAERQVGKGAWEEMPENVRSALTSVAYNYGQLPKNVVKAVSTGDAQAVADAVRSLPDNPGRRGQEANVILGGSLKPIALASLTDEDWQRIGERVERREQAEIIDRERTLRVQEAEAKRISDAEEIEIAKLLADPAQRESVTALSIANNPKLTRDAIQRNTALVDRADRTDSTYGAKFYEFFQKVHLPDGHPDKIGSLDQLVPHVAQGKGLTLSGYNELSRQIQGKGTPDAAAESAMVAQFFKMSHTTLSGTNALTGFKDPKGEALHLQFMTQVLPEYYKQRAQGKTPAQLLSSKSPDYIGKGLEDLKRPLNEVVNDMTRDVGGSADTSTLQGLVAAVQAKKISFEEGERIAIERGWARPRGPNVAPPMSR